MNLKMLRKIEEKYSILERIFPSHELLNYAHLENGEILISEDVDKKIEFLKKFSGEGPDIFCTLNFLDYKEKIISSIFSNYLKALDEAVRDLTK